MRVKGKIVRWKNDKGFGFIEPNNGMPDVFFHEHLFLNQSRRPEVGEEVSFELATNPEGKQRAERILYAGERDPRQRDIFFDVFYSGLSVGFFICLGFLVFLKKIDAIFLVLYLLLSILSFSLYRQDKMKAQSDQRRTPEKKLHFFSLLGGWPGALVAQRVLHHKSRKKSFIKTYYLTVFINIAAVSLYVLSGTNFLKYDDFLQQIHRVVPQFSKKHQDEPDIMRKGPVYSWINQDGKKMYSNEGFPQNEPSRDRQIEWK